MMHHPSASAPELPSLPQRVHVLLLSNSLSTNAERYVFALAIVSFSCVLLLARESHVGKTHDGRFVVRIPLIVNAGSAIVNADSADREHAVERSDDSSVQPMFKADLRDRLDLGCG